jgi:hypothetical protein
MWSIEKTLANKNTPWLPLSTGRYYSNPATNALTTLTLSTNTLYAIPILLPELHTATSINIEVTTQSAGNNLRMGIYADLSGVPDTLLLDAGTVSLTGTGNKAITISQSMPMNWYWLALVANGAAAVRALSQTNAMPMLGFSSGTDTTFHVGWSVAFTYAALPSTFTGGGALMSGAAPRLLLGI